MGAIGSGYGSEWHLLSYLGRHRERLDREVRKITGASSINWLDFPSQLSNGRLIDREWKGLDFIDEPRIQSDWGKFWPQGAGIHNWDAVAQLEVGGKSEWLLVEAKAHTGEIASKCGAKVDGGRGLITAALAQTKHSLGVDPNCDWLEGHYQFCNRVAVLEFLRVHGIAAQLLFIYFTGDRADGRDCPINEAAWDQFLKVQDEHVGLPEGHGLKARIHKLFLPAYTSVRPSIAKPRDLQILTKAVQFAASKHRDQRRKDKEESPYINHPIAVANTLAAVGGIRDLATLCAALLHDTVEDTATTLEELNAQFGHEIAALVAEMTDDKTLDKEVRKQLQIDHARHASARSKTIKLADKICNVSDVAASPPADWPLERRRQYLDWTERVIAGCRGTNKKLEKHYDDVLRSARADLQ